MAAFGGWGGARASTNLCEYIQSERKKLVAVAPELADEAAAAEFAVNVVRFCRDYGFTADEIGGICDSRVLLMLRDFMLEAKVNK